MGATQQQLPCRHHIHHTAVGEDSEGQVQGNGCASPIPRNICFILNNIIVHLLTDLLFTHRMVNVSRRALEPSPRVLLECRCTWYACKPLYLHPNYIPQTLGS